ncbi:MAG: T9SS type A sorting domain-containing protein [Bacteroidia bacterium]|nr:T9SS type A sorting domain-containing protein [Bacteroidia bacterium]
MKAIVLLSSLLMVVSTLEGRHTAEGFIPNMGQVYNQHNKANADVLFSGTRNGVVFHLRKNGISYQFSKVSAGTGPDICEPGKKKAAPPSTEIYRIDITWLNAGLATATGSDATGELRHYYNEVCPNGIVNVPVYRTVVYKNIYPLTDLKWYLHEGSVKYDYIAAAGADPGKLRMKIEGAEKIFINDKGALVIESPLGSMAEDAPVVFQGGRKLPARWVLHGNIAGIEIEGLNPGESYIVDPQVRLWATYYGGTGSDVNRMMATNTSGDVFLGGHTSSAFGTEIATTGSHQSTYGGGGTDCFLVKFNAAGVRQWGTYYGGTPAEYMRGGCTDGMGNVFICGQTYTTTPGLIATPGSHQPVFGGGDDAFLVKFDGNGVRQWGTYYGGAGYDYGTSCAADAVGNVYLVGMVLQQNYSYTNEIATPGSHQPVHGDGNIAYDAFLVKFNSSGVRQWGTYYGGSATDRGYDVACDGSGSVVIIAGTTESTNGTSIATTGSHQSIHNGGVTDAYLAAFDGSGTRQWGTYYGGSSGEDDFSVCAIDGSGNILLGGWTDSPDAIATLNGHQQVYMGATDGFLTLLNSSGVRQWGTYYGGVGTERIRDIFCQGSTIYVCGEASTSTSGVIATAGSYQPVFAGNMDAFLATFSTGGVRQWGTYYGGAGWDYGYRCAPGGNSQIYFAGATSSTSNMSSVGSHQELYGGGSEDNFLVKLCDAPPAPANTSNPSAQSICYGNSTTLSASGSGILGWYNASVGGTYLGGGGSFTTPVLTSSTTYYVQDSTCSSGSRTAIVVTVNALPTVTLGNDITQCGGSVQLDAGNPGASYLWSDNSSAQTLAVSSSGSYSVVVTDVNGCTDADTINVTINTIPNVTISGNLTLCAGDTIPLTAGGAQTYLWSTSATTAVINAGPTVTTVYTVTGTAGNGCTNTASHTVTVNALPTVVYNETQNLVCITWSAITLTPGTPPGGSYSGTSVTGNQFDPGSAGAGTFAIVYSYTDGNGCTNSDTSMITVDLCTGVSGQAGSDHFEVYPNPATDYIELRGFGDLSVVLTDVLGRTVIAERLQGGSARWDVSLLSPGVYFLRCNGSTPVRLVIK